MFGNLFYRTQIPRCPSPRENRGRRFGTPRAGALALTLAGGLALSVLGCATRIRHPPKLAAPASTLFVETRGETGTPVVLLHGLLGSGRYWESALPYIQVDHRVIIPDLLGFGRSPKPDVAYTVEDHLAALHATIEGLVQDEPVFLIGHSMGGLLAIEYVLAHPGRVRGVVLICPPLFDSAKDARRRIGSISPMTAAFAFRPFLAYLMCHLHEGLGGLGRHVARWLNRKMPSAVAEDAAAHTWKSFSGSLHHLILERYLGDLLIHLKGFPILILHGEGDRLADTRDLATLADRVGAEFVAVPGDHHLLLRNERRAMETIRTFLERRSEQGRVPEVTSCVVDAPEDGP